MHAESWGGLIGRSVGAVGRPDAQREVVLTVASDPAAFSPMMFSGPPEWRDDESAGRWHAFVDSLHLAGANLREACQANPLVFGQWRRAVCDHEAQTAARLQVLAWSVQQLYRFESIDREFGELRYRVMEHVSRAWGINEMPVEGSYRDWCTRMTRNYRLLPKAWRYV